MQLLKKFFDALFAFKTFKNELEKKTRKIIKIIRSDNGGEYISNELKKHFKIVGLEDILIMLIHFNRKGSPKGKNGPLWKRLETYC